MTDRLYYSCDSHVVEPPEVYAGLEERFGERAPLIRKDPDGKEGTFLIWKELGRSMPVGRFGIAGHLSTTPRPMNASSSAGTV